MKPLTLRWRESTTAGFRLNLGEVIPRRLESMTLTEISRLELPTIHSSVELGQFFDLTDGDRQRLRLEGDLTVCDNVGGQLDEGEIEVFGSVGHYAGFAMTGGRLVIRGNAQQYACGGLRAGSVLIDGNVGDCLGAAASGSVTGMRGGTVVVTGSVGRGAAARMRRGTIVVHGDVADGLAMRMIAGTVICCGQVSGPYGCGMRRGTLMFMGASPEPIEIIGFSSPEPVELTFLPILLNHLRKNLPKELTELLPKSNSQLPRQAFRSLGDRTHGGLGELLWVHKFLSDG